MAKESLKSYTCRIKQDVIQEIKQYAIHHGISQALVLQKAMECLTSSPTDDRQNAGQEPNQINDILAGELQNKNKQIEALQNTINQQNHLLLLRFKNSGMLIEDNSEEAINIDLPKKGKDKKKKGKKGKR